MDICIYITDSLRCAAETKTALQINYTQKFFNFFKDEDGYCQKRLQRLVIYGEILTFCTLLVGG